jgi:hypothetical protein
VSARVYRLVLWPEAEEEVTEAACGYGERPSQAVNRARRALAGIIREQTHKPAA